MSTYVYLFAPVYPFYPCLCMFTQKLPIFIRVYLCIIMFTYFYHCLLVHVYLCLAPITPECSPMFHVYLCLALITPECSPMFTHFYLCLSMCTLVYLRLYLFTYVYPCLLLFTYVYHCLLIHV